MCLFTLWRALHIFAIMSIKQEKGHEVVCIYATSAMLYAELIVCVIFTALLTTVSFIVATIIILSTIVMIICIFLP